VEILQLTVWMSFVVHLGWTSMMNAFAQLRCQSELTYSIFLKTIYFLSSSQKKHHITIYKYPYYHITNLIQGIFVTEHERNPLFHLESSAHFWWRFLPHVVRLVVLFYLFVLAVPRISIVLFSVRWQIC